jgi:serine/threonine protein kinase HipA of HipAB toxin-antitoxin module
LGFKLENDRDFLKRGQWRLSPAYDLIYSYNPDGAWTSRHQMTINGKREHFTLADFEGRGYLPIIDEPGVILSAG